MGSSRSGSSRTACEYRADLAFGLHRARPDRYPFLLESAASGTPQGRYDLLLGPPGERLELATDGRLRGPGSEAGGGFLRALNAWWRRERGTPATDGLPFHGGWFLLFAYELAGEVEGTLSLPREDGGPPVAAAVRVRTALVVDHARRAAHVVAEPGAEAQAAALLSDLDAAAEEAPGSERRALLEGALAEEPPEVYLEAIRRTLRYIRDGDIFQANLSRLWRGRLAEGVTPAEVYARLRRTNPGPFAGLAVLDNLAVVSSSPERLLQWRDDLVQTRPIAGTRPRSADPAEDAALHRELISHPKERSEHVMLIDLERNDLGRISRPGTVEVDELMVVESYAHVHHIVSNVRGRPRPDVLPGDAIRAVFPGGTITGCPKVRCMEIIAELEGAPRGAYTGSMGYLDVDGSMDLNILIRSLQLRGRALSFRAGGGIVADSHPDAELSETRAKALGLALALEADAA